MLSTKMMLNLNKKNNRYVITAAATLFTLAIMTVTASIMATTTPAAATTTTTTATTTTSPEEAGTIELSAQPVFQEQTIDVSENLINETHVETSFTGNGTLNLPNGTETINTASTGSILLSLMEGTAIGKEVITTEDGSESATAKFFGIARFNMEEGTGRGILVSLVNTNSTGILAPLDGMILAGHAEFDADGTSFTTLWEWQSGIPLPTAITTTPPLEELPSPPMDDRTTNTTTNATTSDAADTNAATTTAAPEEEVGAEGDEQQQPQQTTPTIPPPNPLFE
jgi:hypothetical protein